MIGAMGTMFMIRPKDPMYKIMTVHTTIVHLYMKTTVDMYKIVHLDTRTCPIHLIRIKGINSNILSSQV